MMSDLNKFTPGPWAYNGKSIFSDRIGDCYGYQIAIVGHDMSDFPEEDIEANARLIAAAPDLLEAADRVLAKLDHPTLGVTIYDADALRAAIAKARGQS